jgi:membrane protein
MKRKTVSYPSLFSQAFSGWKKDNATLWSAALAYYTVFSIGPLLLVIVGIIGLILSKTSVEKSLYSQLGGLMGNQGSEFIKTILTSTHKPATSLISTIIGFVSLLLGAAGVFSQLKQLLNHVWGVSQDSRAGIKALLFDRILNMSMVGAIAFLLLVSLIASTVVSAVATYFTKFLPFSATILEILNFAISFVVITFLFALILKVLPDVNISWRRIWPSAILTSLLFTIGKELIGLYIGHSGVASSYGAAGSLIILLLWVYYSSQIIFFGAEFSKAYVLATDKKIVPSKFAVVSRKELTQQQQENIKKKKIIVSASQGFFEGIIDRISGNKKKYHRVAHS